MSLEIQNTSTITTPENFRFVALIYALPGTGKSTWAASAPNPGIIACETGNGAGLLSVADKNLDFVTPTSFAEWETACGGTLFKDKDTLVIDSVSEMYRTFIKDYALTIPRSRGESPKRRLGVPELDDYGTMGEILRRTARKIIDTNPDKHIIFTATEKYDKADPENGQAETLIGPDLPGAMMLGCTAMFDFVLRMRVRSKLRNPQDAKTRYIERYLISQPDGQGSIVKCRGNKPDGSGTPLLDAEEVVNPATGVGMIPFLLDKLIKGYAAGKEK